MTVDDVRARVVVVRAWAIDHEEFGKAYGEETQLWADVLQAIADGAESPAQLAKAALTSRAIAYPRGDQ